VGTATSRSGRAHSTLALVDGRYVLAIMMDGIVLCAMPVGPIEPSAVEA
jgi:hypothetical protein